MGQQFGAAASQGNSKHGKSIFEKLGCNQCHGAQGEGVSGSSQSAGVPRIASTPLSLDEFLHRVRKPKGQMPPFSNEKASDADLTDVYAYLQILKPMAEPSASATNTTRGERLYKDYGCYECHGLQGQGSVSTGGARLGPPRIPLSAFVSYIRQPTGAMPPYTSKAVSDEDASEIYNFLKSIPPPPPLKSISLLNQ
jgi:mono/diheme cytochrome c family protein